MQVKNIGRQLGLIIEANVEVETWEWISEKLHKIIELQSAKDLYLTYSLLAGKISPVNSWQEVSTIGNISEFLNDHGADLLQISRIYLLARVLEEDQAYFTSKVSNLIQVADTRELVTFLRFLILLPNPEKFIKVGVEALRTNIATVFDAIALNNPYPACYFNEEQWNQMYLKAAFMQRNLNDILDVDKKANKALARIISDYAHERWAASRDVDPLLWRPVSAFLDAQLLRDMEHLLQSENFMEQQAASLCCYQSGYPEAKKLLNKYPQWIKKIKNDEICWNNLKKGK